MIEDVNNISVLSILKCNIFVIEIIKFNIIKKVGFVLRLSMFKCYIILWC